MQQLLPPVLDEDDRSDDAETGHGEFESRYRTLVEQIPFITYIQPLGDNANITYVSPQVESLLGYPQSDWIVNPQLVLASIHPDDLEQWLDEDRLTESTQEAFDLRHRMIRADGATIWVRTRARIVRNKQGEPRYWQGTVQDVTEIVLAEQRLAESEQRYRSLFEHNPDAICSFSLDGKVRSANTAMSALIGLPVETLIGNRISEHIPAVDFPAARQAFRTAAHGIARGHESRMIHRDGTIRDVHATLLPIVVEQKIVGVYGVFQDISERKALERQLKHLAFHDPLTGLPNRRLLVERLEEARSNPDLAPDGIALLYLDLDNFKELNDQYGHETGDLALKKLANVVSSCVGPGDTVARLGGDEYLILLTGMTGREDAIQTANRILEQVSRPRVVGGHRISFSASIGIVTGIEPDDPTEVLLRRGDQAMYEAKAGGKARYRVYPGD